MKHIISTLLVVFVLVGLVSCFEDESSLGSPVRKIEIGELRDTAIISYSGNRLVCEPEVLSDYTEKELSYAWYMFDNKSDEMGSEGLPDGYRDSLVAETRRLDYEVNLAPGAYTFVLEVTAADGYVQTAAMQLAVSTNFSDGFYVLKETAEGQTELDIITQEGMTADLLAARLGAPLQGKPQNIAVIFYQSYIDESTQEMAAANFVHVFAESDYCGLRSQDLEPLFDRTNLLFDAMPVDERLYGMVQGSNDIYCLSNKGVRSVATADRPSTGKFGFEAGTGASKYMQVPLDGINRGSVYWEEEKHGLYAVDWTGANRIPYNMPAGVDESRLECIACGSYFWEAHRMLAWFLCKDTEDGKRYLYVDEESTLEGTQAVVVKEVVPDSHLAQASFVAGNTFDGTLIYALHGNELWGHNYEGGEEFKITLQGIGNGETLTYVSNAFINLPGKDGFNRLLVGTQKGAEYRLYFYDRLVGGSPTEAPFRVVKGKGVLKAVRYASSAVTYDDMRSAYQTGPVFPVCD